MQSASDKLISCAWRTDEHHLLTHPVYFLSWLAPAGAQIKHALWQSAYTTASRSFPKPQSVTLPVSPALHLLNTPGALYEPVRKMVQRDDLKGYERGCSRGTDELKVWLVRLSCVERPQTPVGTRNNQIKKSDSFRPHHSGGVTKECESQ